MKILHILDHSLPLHSGYTFRSANIFREQRRRGWEPLVVTSPKHEASWKGPWLPEEEWIGVRYYRSGAVPPSAVPGLSEGRLMMRLERRLRQVIARENPVLVHAHSPVLNAIPALWAARRAGVPVVYEIRAFWEDAAVDHGTTRQGSLRYGAVKALETWVCSRVDHVIVLCEGLRQDLISRGIPAWKITPVYNGVDVDAFQPAPPDEELLDAWNLRGRKVIGFLGSFYRYEGLDLLVRAFARLASEDDSVRLLLVGGGETTEELRSLARDLGVADRVILPGRIPHERVPGVYAFVDVLVYPRYAMRLTDLVTPLKPLEAMAMVKAVVASDVGGHREQIQDGRTGLLFPAGNEESLHEALKRAIADEALRERLGRAGREWVRDERSWERTTEAYRRIYSALGTPITSRLTTPDWRLTTGD